MGCAIRLLGQKQSVPISSYNCYNSSQCYSTPCYLYSSGSSTTCYKLSASLCYKVSALQPILSAQLYVPNCSCQVVVCAK
jgi:hypothetical protein